MCSKNLNYLLWRQREAIYLPLAFVYLLHFRYWFIVLFCGGTQTPPKRPNVFVSTHLGEVLQGERLGHVVELCATHGFGHGQHSQTVGGGQLLLWKSAKSADGETNVDGGREQKKKKNARLIEADGGENLSPCRSKRRSCETSWRRGEKLEGGGGRRGGGG